MKKYFIRYSWKESASDKPIQDSLIGEFNPTYLTIRVVEDLIKQLYPKRHFIDVISMQPL